MRDVVDAVTKVLADAGWRGFRAIDRLAGESPPASPSPEWAPGPLLDSRQRARPPLGWPRETDSVCPRCVIETRKAIPGGERDRAELADGRVGEITARILEENGTLVIRKTCPAHGTFEDLLSIDPEFSRRVEQRDPAPHFRTLGGALVHGRATWAVTGGRGAVLTIDLTSRCHMTCRPCFTDAGPVGCVHEPSLDEIKEVLDGSISLEPRRPMTVQFSGGEPTTSPHFLEACRHAKDAGYVGVQAATNGLRFAHEPELAYQAREAGLDLAHVPLEGVSHRASRRRHVPQPFEVKQRALDVMHDAGIGILPVTRVVNTVNDDQVGPMLDFVLQNSWRMAGVSFQPVSFTGRDEEIRDEDRRRWRYTLSHLARDLQRHSHGKIDAHRDWYPLGACHPSCGSGFLIVANRQTGAWSTLTQFFDLDRFTRDIAVLGGTARGRPRTLAQVALSFVRNFDARKAPSGLTLVELAKLFFAGDAGGALGKKRREQDWTFLAVGGRWFQDLWTYDAACDAHAAWRPAVGASSRRSSCTPGRCARGASAS